MKTPQASGCENALVVLDTNAVLDWLVFVNPACVDWDSRMAGGRVRWLVTAAMRDEMSVVLSREWLRDYAVNTNALWHAWARWATPCETIEPPPDIGRRMRCTDRSDQKFIDLAITHGARWLITRDRAVLKLARRARDIGLVIATPEAWTLPSSEQT